jgi:transcriptional/translational regulatory protein YebC/TACO1
MKRAGTTFDIVCDPATFNKVQEALTKNSIKPQVAEITYLPKAPRDVDVETGKRVMKLMGALDDHDDVQNVYTDMNLTEQLVAAAEKE